MSEGGREGLRRGGRGGGKGGGGGGEVVGRARQLGVVRLHTTCLPDVPRPAVAPGLRAGSSTLVRAQLECCGNVSRVCVRASVCACVCRRALAHRRPAVIQCGRPSTPLTPSPPPPPHHRCHHLASHRTSATVPFGQACPHAAASPRMPAPHVRTHRHERTHGFNQEGMRGPL